MKQSGKPHTVCSTPYLHPNHASNSGELHFPSVSRLKSFRVSLFNLFLLSFIDNAIIIRMRVLISNLCLSLHMVVNLKAMSVSVSLLCDVFVIWVLQVSVSDVLGPQVIPTHKPRINSDSAYDMTYDLMRMCSQHLVAKVVLTKQVHFFALDDRYPNSAEGVN